MLLTRIITALIILPILLLGIVYLPDLDFAGIIIALMLIAAWEWAGLVGLTKTIYKVIYMVCIAVGLFLSAFIAEFTIFLIAAVFWLWALVAIVHYQKNGSGAGFQFSSLRAVIGFIVLVSTGVAIVALKAQPGYGPAWLITGLFITFAADVGGYFAGRYFGKKPLCPRVSPKKTWEGFAGGMIFAVIVAAIAGHFLSLPSQSYFYFLLLALVTALFSVVGDLSVSLLKRMTGLKDSGKIFPGHGGMLDRLDSIAAALVIFMLGAMLLPL